MFILDAKLTLSSVTLSSHSRKIHTKAGGSPPHGMLMEVPEDDYRAFYKQKRRQKYLKERSRDNRDFSYGMLTPDEFNGEDILAILQPNEISPLLLIKSLFWTLSLKACLKRHQVKQKDFVTRPVEAAMEKADSPRAGGWQ